MLAFQPTFCRSTESDCTTLVFLDVQSICLHIGGLPSLKVLGKGCPFGGYHLAKSVNWVASSTKPVIFLGGRTGGPSNEAS